MNELNTAFSTTRLVTREVPIIKEPPDAAFKTLLFLPEGERRQGEGGLRTHGYFKRSLPDKPLITVITVVFNGAQHLEETILSVIGQTYDNVEYIIIDGGSTDGTLDIIRQYEHAVDYWVSEKDEGIGNAWNKGLGLAAGGYILILNSGDRYELNFLKNAVTHCNVNSILCYDAKIMTQFGKQVGLFKARPHLLYKGMYIPHNFVVVPKLIYQKMGAYVNIEFAMDFEWFHRYFKYAGNAGFTVQNQPAGCYYLGGKSDIDFKKSFMMNERILIDNGTSVLAARYYRVKLTLQHTISRYIRWR